MKRYLVGKNAEAYNLVGKGVKNRKFIQTEGIFLREGRSFDGLLVFIPMTIGFQPMIKVLDPRLKNNVYYSTQDVKVDGDSNVEMSSFDNYNWSSNRVGINYYGLANSNTAPELDTYKNDYPQYSSANGDFWKKLLGSAITPEQKEAANKIEELTPEEMSQAHKTSGSKLSFGDWLKSEQAVGLANNMSALAISLLNKGDNNSSSNNSSEDSQNSGSSDSPNKKESKILGMHPLTFGVTTVGVLIGIAVAVVLLKGNNKK